MILHMQLGALQERNSESEHPNLLWWEVPFLTSPQRDGDIIFIVMNSKQTCPLLQREMLYQSSKVVHFTDSLEKVVCSNYSQCFYSQDMPKHKRRVEDILTTLLFFFFDIEIFVLPPPIFPSHCCVFLSTYFLEWWWLF